MQVPLLFRPVEFFTCAKRWVLGLPGYVQGLLVAVVYLAINPPLTGISTYYWYLPSGFRFAGLLLLPYRLWPWLLMGVFTARAWNSLSWNDQLVRALLDAIPHPLATALAVFWLRRMHSSLNLDDPVQMVRLLSAMLFSALLVLLCNVVYVTLTSTHRTDMPVFMLSSFLGEFVAVLIIAPLACAIVKAWPHRPRLSRFSKDAFIFLCFPLAIFVFTQSMGNTPLLLQYLRVLVVLPSLYFAFRYGWRGAALSITSISTVVALFHIQDASYTPGEIAAVQMLVAVVGTASLLLGSSLDERYKSHQLLTHQNLRLLQANIDLQRLGHDLQDAAQRNLQIEEEQRRRIAAEIHDELGQNLTALQTELRLAERRINRGDVLAIGDGMDQRIRDMDRPEFRRHSVAALRVALFELYR